MHARFRHARAFALITTTTLLGAAAGCNPPVATVGSASIHQPSASRIHGAYAPAGQRVTVRLVDPIDTLRTATQAPFRAYLETPVMGNDGQVFAPAGAIVRGRVVSLGHYQTPHVRLEFDRIETAFGAARLRASLRDAQFRQYAGPVMYIPMTGYSNGGNFGYGYGNPYAPWVYGGGPVSSDYQAYRPIEIHLPRNARLNLVLTEPIYAPGTVVVR